MNIATQEAQPNTGADQQQDGGLPQFDLATATKEQFLDRLTVDPVLRDEYLANAYDDKFSRLNALIDGKHVPEGGQQQSQQAPAQTPAQPASDGSAASTGSGEQQSQQPAEELIDLTGVKIPKGLFGTYLSGERTPEKALLEALKGNSEKDATIANFVQRDNNAISDTLALRKELIKAQKERADVQLALESLKNQKPAQPVFGNMQEIEQIDFDVLNDFDPFDPATHEKADKAKGHLGKLKKVFESLKGQQAAATQQPPPAQSQAQPGQPTGQQPAAPQMNPEVEKSLNNSVFELEMADIEAMQAANPELRTSVPFRVLNSAIDGFQKAVARVAGMTDTVAAAGLYFSNTERGETLRNQCKIQGINAPGEGDDLAKFDHIVGKLRPLRLQNIESYRSLLEKHTGKKLNDWELLDAPNTSYGDLVKGVKKYEPPQSAPPPQQQQQQQSPTLQQKIEQHKAENQPPAHTSVPEIPPSMGAPQTDVLNMLDSEVMELTEKFTTNRKLMTQEELARFKNVCAWLEKNRGGPPVESIFKE